MLGKMFAEFLQALDLEGKMREIRLHLHRPAVGKMTKFDQFFAARRFQKCQFRTARRFVPAHFFEAEDFFVEFHRAFQVIEPITRVQEFANFHGAHHCLFAATVQAGENQEQSPLPKTEHLRLNQRNPDGMEYNPIPFPQTRWSLVLSAKDGKADASFDALESLALSYWQPIYSWLRGQERSHEEARDDAQGFFAYLLSREFLRNVQPEGGRFRNFLLVCLRRWMKDERHRAINVKRRAEVQLQPWDNLEGGAFHTKASSPEEAFDRAWAQALVARSMKALAARWKNRPGLFAALRLMVESPGNVEKYAAIAARLSMTEGAVGKAAHDLRQQFAEQIRQEIRDTVARDEDVKEELRYLMRLMRS